MWGNRWFFVVTAWTLVIWLFSIFRFDQAFLADRFIPMEPRSFIFSLPMIAFIFALFARLNERWDLSFFNRFSKISYTFMLIQHVVINTFFWQYKVTDFSMLGALLGLLAVLAVTVYLSNKITAVYKPVEEWIMRYIVRR